VVEFALVAPLLLLMVLGIAEFGRAYHVQTTLSQAAREGVRVMAIQNDPDEAVTVTQAAAGDLARPLTIDEIEVLPDDCDSGDTATVTVTYVLPFVTNLFGPGVTLTGRGVMRCSGNG